jgi:glycosyltransferase involved in cell wall biosynthesis
MGHESQMVVQHQYSRESSVFHFAPPLDPRTRFRRLARRLFLRQTRKFHDRRRPTDATFFSDDLSEHGADVLGQMPSTEILNLHWISGFFEFQDFFSELPAGLPVVWTAHDMNPFTGGCHHAADCRKFWASCGACPQLGSSVQNDLSKAVWNRKHSAYRRFEKRKFSLVAPSRWLAGEARASSLLGDLPITIIPNGLDMEAFAPRHRPTARDVLGIPPNAKVLLFVSAYLNDRYKGLSQLLGAVAGLRSVPNLFLLAVGKGAELIELPMPNKTIDFLTDERMLSLAYSAADLFVLPSVADNLPNTAIEALACGLPIVAFEVGGIPDVVRNGLTGLLVEPGNTLALAAAIEELMNSPDLLAHMSANCRRIAIDEYSVEMQARRYTALYSSLLVQHSACTTPNRSEARS